MKVTVATMPKQFVAGRDSFDQKVIDWKNSSDRKWLMSHLYWAMHNDKHVSLTSESN